ncbi:hypothetical protein ACF06W_11330 [Streptomyces albus]|uniref:hypothetical protein n=1 Tax=Streptomyces albus TaxID=1888 RepID=UPI0036F73F38
MSDMEIRLQHFDNRRVWCTYAGQTWPADDRARAIRDAREFYKSAPHVWVGGVRLVDMAGRILWSIGADATFRLDVDWGDGGGFEPLWGERGLSLWEAEHERDRNAEFLGRPVRVVREEYPRETLSSKPRDPFALPESKTFPVTCQVADPVPPAIFQYGEDGAA